MRAITTFGFRGIWVTILFLAGGWSFGDDLYVQAGNPGADSPYSDWTTAAATIQDAVDAAKAGDTIRVGDGVYDTGGSVVAGRALASRVAVTKEDITIISMNGPEATIIKGEPDPNTGGIGPDAVRGVYLLGSGIVFVGFTVTNGYTASAGDNVYDRGGGGMIIASSATVSNCVIAGNYSDFGGGGFYMNNRGAVFDSLIAGNHTGGQGGGGAYSSTTTDINTSAGLIKGCVFSNNTAQGSSGGFQVSARSILFEGAVLSKTRQLPATAAACRRRAACSTACSTAIFSAREAEAGRACTCRIVSP